MNLADGKGRDCGDGKRLSMGELFDLSQFVWWHFEDGNCLSATIAAWDSMNRSERQLVMDIVSRAMTRWAAGLGRATVSAVVARRALRLVKGGAR